MKFIYYLLLFVIGAWLQMVWETYASVGGLAPRILLVLTVALASRDRHSIAMTFAFLWGLFSDAMRVRLFGADALLLTCVAYAVGLLRGQIDVSSLVPQVAVLGIISFCYAPALAAVGLLFEGHAFWVGWKGFLLTPLYNCLIAPVGIHIVGRLSQRHDL